MTMLQSVLCVMSLTVSAQLPAADDIVIPDAARRYVVVDRPGQKPLVVKGSDRTLARADLVGDWQVAYLEQRATSQPVLAAQLHVRFSRGKIELFQGGGAPKVVAYNVNTTHYPRHFDWYRYCGHRLELQRGVYWLEGETLMLCLGPVNGRRATQFVTTPYDGRTLFALERISQPEPSPGVTAAPAPTPAPAPEAP